MYAKMVLGSRLLLSGQVIVCYVRAAHIILFDDILPCGLRTLVGEIKVLDVVVFQAGVLLGRVAEGFLAGSAPCACL